MRPLRHELRAIDGADAGCLHAQAVARVAAQGWAPRQYLRPDGAPTLASLLALGEPTRLELRPWATVAVREWTCRAAEIEAFDLDARTRTLAGEVVMLANDVALDLGATAPVSSHRAVAREVAREIVVNALVHRSFEDEALAHPVMVDVFADGWVVRSPGGSTGSTSATGFSRNPTLHGLIVALGQAHQRGHGARYVRRSARHAGWIVDAGDDDGWYRVEVRVDLDAVDAAESDTRRQRVPLADAEARVLVRIDDAPRTRREIVELVGLPDSTVRAVLNSLVAKGLVRPTREAPRSKYQAYVRA